MRRTRSSSAGARTRCRRDDHVDALRPRRREVRRHAGVLACSGGLPDRRRAGDVAAVQADDGRHGSLDRRCAWSSAATRSTASSSASTARPSRPESPPWAASGSCGSGRDGAASRVHRVTSRTTLRKRSATRARTLHTTFRRCARSRRRVHGLTLENARCSMVVPGFGRRKQADPAAARAPASRTARAGLGSSTPRHESLRPKSNMCPIPPPMRLDSPNCGTSEHLVVAHDAGGAHVTVTELTGFGRPEGRRFT